MKRILTTCMIIIMLLSCSKKKNFLPYTVYPEKDLEEILDSFIIETKNRYPVNEIYIDHLSPQKYNLVIFSGEESLTKGENQFYGQTPIECSVISGIKFDIYSGVEHFFDKNPNTPPNYMNKKDYFRVYSTEGIYWLIKKNGNKTEISKQWYVYPFTPYPSRKIQFAAPIIKDDEN